MVDLAKLLTEILLKESASVTNVNDAINKHYRVIINYKTRGEDIANGSRLIEVYAYGLSKAGNPVIRAFQPYGDTASRVPSWKLFRLDRITTWKPTKQIFTHPASDYYKGLGEFNKDGDLSMSVVYNIASFGGGNKNYDNIYTPEPKKKEQTPQQAEPEIFKTDTEKNMERLKQQLNDPVYLSKVKANDSFKDFSTKQDKNITGPKKKDNKAFTNEPDNSNLYKTDTETGMENLSKQLENPKYVDKSVLDQYLKDKEKRNKKWQIQR